MRNAWLTVAEAAGTAVRALRGTWAGLAGAACVCVGVGLVYVPAGLVAAGAFLLILDSRRP